MACQTKALKAENIYQYKRQSCIEQEHKKPNRNQVFLYLCSQKSSSVQGFENAT